MNKVLTILVFSAVFYETFAKDSEIVMQDDYNDYNTKIYKKYVQMDKQLKVLVEQNVKKLLPFLLEARENVNISGTCSKNLFDMITGFRKLTNWSLNFLDSMGKLQSGVLVGNLQMFGEYQECFDTKVKKNGKVDFQGKYCLALVKPLLPKVKKIPRFYDKLDGLINATRNSSGLMKEFVSRAHLFYAFNIAVGLCVPSGCSKKDISEIINYSLGDYLNTTVSHCFKEGDIYFFTTTRIAIVSVMVLFGIFVIICTVLDNTSEKEKNSKFAGVFQAFSLTRNFPRLMNTKLPDNSIPCLNGIRVLTIFWIILGHEYFFYLLSLNSNHLLHYEKVMKSFILQTVVNGFLSVDVFFFISGFVNIYTRMLIKQNGKTQPGIFKMIIHRLWRIYPALIIAFLTFMLLSEDHPFTYHIQKLNDKNCEQNFWRDFIFINNFYNPFTLCLPQTWFIAADMQLFLVSLFTIPVLLRKPKRGIILHVSLIIIVNLCYMSYWYLDDVSAATLDPTKLEQSAFEKTYQSYILPVGHVGSYFIGILMGYGITANKKIKIPKMTQLFGWILASFFFLSMLFMTYRWNTGYLSSQTENSLYGAWSKTIFILGFSWLVFCCATGHARLFNYILSLKLWIPISRITYMLYLVSPTIQAIQNMQANFPKDFSDISITWSYFADVSISLLLSFSLVLMFESPLLALEKLLLGKKQVELTKPSEGKEFTCNETKENGKITIIHL